MYRSRLSKGILLFVILVSIGFFFLIGAESSRQSIVSTQNKQKHHNSLWVQGLRFQSFNGKQIIAKAVVKELKVNPRKFSIFNIKPLKELTLNNVTMEFHKSEEDPSGIDLGDLIHKPSPGSSAKSSFSKRHKFGATGTGLITRVIINKLIFKIYNKNNLSLIIKSAKAYLNLKKGEVIFRNAVVEDIDKKKLITSHKIVFKSGENVLRVPGQYALMSPAGSKKGNGLNINL
jgi:lipopolysaccharide export system protein LptC